MAWPKWWGVRGAARVDESRWVVLDVETTGLDPASDALLAIAAIAVRIDWASGRACIMPGDSFEAELRADTAGWDRGNILVHGIGLERQRAGTDPAAALAAFAEFAGGSPLLAFHSGFDEVVVNRATRAHLGLTLANPWLDIELLCAAACGDAAARTLDEWMEHFGIECAARHQAAADAMAECEILLRVWPLLSRECRNWADVSRLAAGQRWLRSQAGRASRG